MLGVPPALLGNEGDRVSISRGWELGVGGWEE